MEKGSETKARAKVAKRKGEQKRVCGVPSDAKALRTSVVFGSSCVIFESRLRANLTGVLLEDPRVLEPSPPVAPLSLLGMSPVLALPPVPWKRDPRMVGLPSSLFRVDRLPIILPVRRFSLISEGGGGVAPVSIICAGMWARAWDTMSVLASFSFYPSFSSHTFLADTY